MVALSNYQQALFMMLLVSSKEQWLPVKEHQDSILYQYLLTNRNLPEGVRDALLVCEV